MPSSLGCQGALSWKSHDFFSWPCDFVYAGPSPDKPLSAWKLIFIFYIPVQALLLLGSFFQTARKG